MEGRLHLDPGPLFPMSAIGCFNAAGTGSDARRLSVCFVLANGVHGKGGISQGMRTTLNALAANPMFAASVFASRMFPNRVWADLLLPIQLFRFIGRLILERPRIVHVKLSVGGSVLRKAPYVALAKLANRFVVIQVHGSNFDEFVLSAPWVIKSLVRKMLCTADAVIALTPGWAERLVDAFGLVRQQIRVVENVVDDPGPAPRTAVPGEEPRVLFLGEIGERKGLGDLLMALGTPHARRERWHAIIAGHGDASRYVDICRRLALAERVSFIGWQARPGVVSLLRSASMLVLPSYSENQPNAIIEAMAYGLPVIASRVGGIPEIVTDGETGYLVDPGDLDSLSDRLCLLLRDRARCQVMGEAGRLVYERRFRPFAQLIKFRTVYESIVHR